MMDLSDGLSSDLRKLCVASGFGAVVEATKLPVVIVTDGIAPVRLGLHGGDDYELLFTVAKKKARLVPRSLGGVELTAIGEITRGREVMVVDENGRKRSLEAGGWDPFVVHGKKFNFKNPSCVDGTCSPHKRSRQ